jgi:hypothetical protein
VILTVALAVPSVCDTVIHGSDEAAVHRHGPLVTTTDTSRCPAAKLVLSDPAGLKATVHAALTFAVNLWPAIVAVRACACAPFAAAVTVTEPLPLPSLGDTVSPVPSLAAVQADGWHPSGNADTVTTCDPPAAPNTADGGETVNAHPTSTVTVCFALRESTFAVTSTVPTATAVTSPPFTVTFDESEDAHWAAAVRSSVCPLESVARAVQCDCWPNDVRRLASQETMRDASVGVGLVELHAATKKTMASDRTGSVRTFIRYLQPP